jgi:hypothetical protein
MLWKLIAKDFRAIAGEMCSNRLQMRAPRPQKVFLNDKYCDVFCYRPFLDVNN